MLKKLGKNFFEADDALALLLVGVLVIILIFALAFFIIMSIEKIAFAMVMFGVGILALGAGVFLLKKGVEWIKGG